MKIKLLIFFSILIGTLLLGCDSASHKDRATLKRLQENGFIPQTVTQTIVRDSHGGFHGDGCMFVTFISSDTNQSWKWPSEKWIILPLDSRAKETLNIVVKDLSIPADQLPDMSSSSVYYLIDDSSDRRDAFTGHLYIQDKEKNQYWYFNVTT